MARPGEKLPTQHMLTRHLSREAEESLRQTLPDQEKERLDAIKTTMIPMCEPRSDLGSAQPLDLQPSTSVP